MAWSEERAMDVAKGFRDRRWWMVAGGVLLVVAIVATMVRGAAGPPVIRLSGEASAEPLAADGARTLSPTAESALWLPVDYRFELADGVDVPDGKASAWRLESPSDLAVAAAALTGHLGLPTPQASPWNDGGLLAGADGREGASLWISRGGEWSYSDSAGYAIWTCAEPEVGLPAPEADPGEAGTGDLGEGLGDERPVLDRCPAPEPPGHVPDGAEAKRLAEALFAAVGTPGPVAELDAQADEWGAHVFGRIEVAGDATDLHVSASFGQDGILTSASGLLGTLEEVGGYPTVDTATALERLHDLHLWRGGNLLAPAPMPMPMPDLAPLPDAEGTGIELAPAPGDADDPDELEDLGPTRPLPAPEPGQPDDVEEVTVVLVSVERALSLGYAADGELWLIPSYRFVDAEGGHWQVFAVADGYLDVGGAPHDGPGDGDAGGTGDGSEPGQPGVGEPDRPVDAEPVDDGPTVDPDVPTTDDDPAAPEPNDAVSADIQAAAEAVIGAPEAEAVDKIESIGAVARVIHRDGEDLMVTDDHRLDRINLEVVDGRVVGTSIG
jgi:hypothetical protein